MIDYRHAPRIEPTKAQIASRASRARQGLPMSGEEAQQFILAIAPKKRASTCARFLVLDQCGFCKWSSDARDEFMKGAGA